MKADGQKRTSKKVSYAESDEEDDFKLRAPKRRKQVISDDEDDDLFVDAAEVSEASGDDDGDGKLHVQLLPVKCLLW
jgi:hypothetical protein